MSDQSPLRGDPLWLRLTRLIHDEIYRVVEQRLQPFVTGRKLDLSKREGIVGFLPPSRGGSGNNVGLKDHDHSGMASGNAQQLRQANTHQSADTDSTATSLHHTLGTAATQAAAGNHGHALANLTDVALASPQNAQVLTYDGTASKWKNAAGGSGHTIQDHTTALTQRGALNFTGIGVSATDNASTSATDVTVPGVAVSAPITVSGGNGVAQTVGISPATSAAAGSMSAADKSKLDGIAAGAGRASDNLLIDAGFEVWSRGAGPFTANNAYINARTQIVLGGTSTISVAKDTTNYDTGSGACAAITYTHGSAVSSLNQKVEDYGQLRGRSVAFSARVRGSVASAARLRITDGISTWYSGYHSGSGGYETLSVVATIATTAASVSVALDLGASGTYYLDNAMLVTGAQPQDYQPLTSADDLARCQRYLEAHGGVSAYQERFYISDPVNWGWFTFRPWATTKAVTPTVTKSGSWTQDGSATGVPAFAVGAVSTMGYYLYLAPTAGATAGVVRFYATDATGLIIAEANP